MAAEPTCLGAAAITVAEEAGAAVAAPPPNDFVTVLPIADHPRHLLAPPRLTDLTEAVLAVMLTRPVLELQDAMNASRSCSCLHDAVQSCEELWARLYEEHFGGSSTSSGGNDSRGTGVAASGRCISSGSGSGSNGKASEGTYSGGVQVSGSSVGGRSGDGYRQQQQADATGISRQASTAEPEADSWVSGGGIDANHGSRRTVMAAPSPPSRPCIVTRQPASDTDMASRPLDDAILGVMPCVRVANTARHGGTSGPSDRIGGDGNITWSVVAVTAASRARPATAAAAAAAITAAGRTRAAVMDQGGPMAGSGSDDGRGNGGQNWRERFKARYVRESSERRHQRRVKLYRYQAAVQEARSELAAARRRVSDETHRLEELQSQIAELERARQAGIAGSYWVPSAVQQHFSRVVTQGSAVDVSIRVFIPLAAPQQYPDIRCKYIAYPLV
ncbi:hypothetical protein Vafri_1781 [Volvox africanus]|nr:hypothetical protein Vafri_1781 [Volvox africanus]